MNNKLLLDFRENLVYNFFESSFYFEYKKFKIQNHENIIGKSIKETSDIINDNFSLFLNEYNL
jgi:RecB family endonuclease NucS